MKRKFTVIEADNGGYVIETRDRKNPDNSTQNILERRIAPNRAYMLVELEHMSYPPVQDDAPAE